MSAIAATLLLIVLLFVLLLVLKRFLQRLPKICAICLAVSLSWIILLVLRQAGYVTDDLVLGILMGQSSLGIYYLLERKVSEKLLVFRLPTLLTLTLIVFTVVSKNWYLDAWLLVLAVWFIIGTLYIYRNNKWAKSKVKSLIECCSNW